MKKHTIIAFVFAMLACNTAMSAEIIDPITPGIGGGIITAECAGAAYAIPPSECTEVTVTNSCKQNALGSVCDCNKANVTNNTTHIVTVYANKINVKFVPQGLGECNKECTCDNTTVSAYMCAKNYYGNPTSPTDTNACTRCPANSITTDIGATSITSCYLKAGRSFSDTTGTYEYTENCYYKN